MNIPPSMRAELARWNDGDGIDLEGWIAGSGNYALAIGYATLFWPRFVEIDGYIVREGITSEQLRDWERTGASRREVEAVVNHLHFADLHRHANALLSEDKLVALGEVLREIHAAKLVWQFPHSPCVVQLHVPEPGGDLDDHQLTFWQARHAAD